MALHSLVVLQQQPASITGYGSFYSQSGAGIYGYGGSSSGYTAGVYGAASSFTGTGVIGYAMGSTGTNNGVKGESSTDAGKGVLGYASSTTGVNFGVWGESASPDGYSGFFPGGKFYVGGNMGIGITNPVARLDINGQVRISGGNPGTGKVLVSNATGLATWQTPDNGPWTRNGTMITCTGQVGINVSFPTTTLELNGGSVTYQKFFHSSSGTENTDGLLLGITGSNNIGYLWNYENEGIHLVASNSLAVNIGANRNVAIGNFEPTYKLDVEGNRINLWNGTKSIAMRTDGSAGILDLSYSGGNPAISSATSGENVVINPSRNLVGIRTWAPQYELDVNGIIRTTLGMYYGGSAGSADGIPYSKPDYVFEDDYNVMDPGRVAEFLMEEKHLPWITSAEDERKENGDATNMTRMAFETVETVENLQLQIIEMDRKIKTLMELINAQQKEIEKLKGR